MKKILSVILMVVILIGVCISLTACDEPSAPTGSYADRQNTKAVADSLSQSQPTPTDIIRMIGLFPAWSGHEILDHTPIPAYIAKQLGVEPKEAQNGTDQS